MLTSINVGAELRLSPEVLLGKTAAILLRGPEGKGIISQKSTFLPKEAIQTITFQSFRRQQAAGGMHKECFLTAVAILLLTLTELVIIHNQHKR